MSDRHISEMDHDDGLVHEHAWASADRGAAVHAAPCTQPAPDAEIGHDEGLVHDHGWSRTGRVGAAAE